jgi:hypothetical protein
MDRDIAGLQEKLAGAASSEPKPEVAAAIQEALGRPIRDSLAATHTPPAQFHPARELALTLALEKPAAAVHLYYRHVNQAERFQVAVMEGGKRGYAAKIPAAYTDTQYPLEYYFEVQESPGKALLYPGLSANLTQQPYFAVRRAKV